MLFDYSNRQWSGLIRGFYRPRWEKFLACLAAQPAGTGRFNDRDISTSHGRPGDTVTPFYRDLSNCERTWCEGRETYPAKPEGDSVKIAYALLQKWGPLHADAFARFNLGPADKSTPREKPTETAPAPDNFGELPPQARP